jgi:uncharacterized protein with FMN-binding domain
VRRAIAALVSTAAGTVLLVGAKSGFGYGSTGPGTVPLANRALPATPAGSGAPGTLASPGGLPVGGLPVSGLPVGGTTAPGGSPPGPTATAAPGATSKTTPAAPKATTKPPKSTTMRDGTWNGAPIYNGYGNIELSITVAGGKITNVTTLDSPQESSRSKSINANALPKLRQETLVAQSASINTISGATETSDAYRQSLASAITKAFGG